MTLTSVSAGGGNNVTTSSNVQMLSVSHNNVSEVAPTALRGLKALLHLRLDNNRLGRLPAAMFADTPSLGALSLADNRHLDVGTLAAALTPTRLALLRLLDLSGVDPVAADGRLPEAVFSQLPALQQLVLGDLNVANMSGEFFAALCPGTSCSSCGLSTLDLSGSSIGEVGRSRSIYSSLFTRFS